MPESKVALVTGGSSGIGYAIAHRFIREGYSTVITGRDPEKLNNAVRELGGCCTGIPLDMKCLDKIPEFVHGLQCTYGKIDVLINNAGINQKKTLVEVTDEDFENIININLTGLFALSREVVKLMLTQESRGVIINISSMAAHYGIPKVVSYTASKTALEGLTRAMAVELSPFGIRVNSVAPGFIRTPMSSRALDNDLERKNRVLSRTPMHKLGEPEEIANAVYFLASDQASFITGQILKVDGGNSIGF
jgi:NAD(P)-dependent dehydrogenase (short-subunit alcohol dehydrogenase family)